MAHGTQIHKEVEEWLHNNLPNTIIETEVKRSFNITLPDGSLFIIGAKVDAIVNNDTLIEIKYLYSRSAYYQILIEKLVFSEMSIKCFQYGNLRKPAFIKNILIPIKADYEMSIVYAGRIITSLYHLPPRFPNAHANHPVCNKCIHKEVCYSDSSDLDIGTQHDKWNEFKSLSQPYIDSVRNARRTL